VKVALGVALGVAVAIAVAVAVFVGEAVNVGVAVRVGVAVFVAVAVLVAVGVGVSVGVLVAVLVAVGVGVLAGGNSVLTARCAFRRPFAHRVPVPAIGSAPLSIWLRTQALSSGAHRLVDQTSPAAPETCGAACEVP